MASHGSEVVKVDPSGRSKTTRPPSRSRTVTSTRMAHRFWIRSPSRSWEGGTMISFAIAVHLSDLSRDGADQEASHVHCVLLKYAEPLCTTGTHRGEQGGVGLAPIGEFLSRGKDGRHGATF